MGFKNPEVLVSKEVRTENSVCVCFKLLDFQKVVSFFFGIIISERSEKLPKEEQCFTLLCEYWILAKKMAVLSFPLNFPNMINKTFFSPFLVCCISLMSCLGSVSLTLLTMKLLNGIKDSLNPHLVFGKDNIFHLSFFDSCQFLLLGFRENSALIYREAMGHCTITSDMEHQK